MMFIIYPCINTHWNVMDVHHHIYIYIFRYICMYVYMFRYTYIYNYIHIHPEADAIWKFGSYSHSGLDFPKTSIFYRLPMVAYGLLENHHAYHRTQWNRVSISKPSMKSIIFDSKSSRNGPCLPSVHDRWPLTGDRLPRLFRWHP